jgi:hypothetical protein
MDTRVKPAYDITIRYCSDSSHHRVRYATNRCVQ